MLSMHQAPGSICSTDESDKVAHTCNLITWEVKAGGSDIQGHLWVHSKLENSLGYKRDLVKEREKKGEKMARGGGRRGMKIERKGREKKSLD